jgi:hypothetical protein
MLSTVSWPLHNNTFRNSPHLWCNSHKEEERAQLLLTFVQKEWVKSRILSFKLITVKKNVLRFRDNISSMIFNDRPTCTMTRPMKSFVARKIDKKMLTFLEFHRSNTGGTLLVIFKNSVRTAKKPPHFTITNINWLTLFKEIIHVYTEHHTKAVSTKSSVTDC